MDIIILFYSSVATGNCFSYNGICVCMRVCVRACVHEYRSFKFCCLVFSMNVIFGVTIR